MIIKIPEDVAMKRKGAVVISETMLLAFGIVVSFVLLATMGSMIFKGQSGPAEESALALVSKDIASTIDRVAAEAGSVAIVYRVPKGMKVDVEIDYKRLQVTGDDKTYSAPFQALTHTKPYVLTKPGYICMVKNQDDMRITLSKDKCICNTNDNRCDPACVVTANCDPDCNVDNIEDRVCDSRCSKAGDSICDPDCFTNDKDKVNEARDCITDFDEDSNGNKRSKEKDRICDADSHMIEDTMCDIDCLNNGTSTWGICDIDCNKYNTTDINGTLVSEDGYCDLDCGYKGTKIKRLYEDGVCDLDCAGPVNTSWLDRSENGICDPDCGGLYDPDCGKCAGLGADCSGDPCCGPDMGMDLTCCPGPKTCAENKDDGSPACDANGWCEISPFSSAPENPAKRIVKWPKGVDGTHPKNWENPYTTQNTVPGHLYKDCTDATDGICYSEQWCETDTPPCATYSTANDGYYDEDCGGEGNGCQWICMMPQLDNDNTDCDDVHLDMADQTRGRESRLSSNFCSTTDDGFCDTDCDLSKWKRWDPDCGEPDCDAKVDKGQWTKAVCADDEEMWCVGKIEVCGDSAKAFLDRRGWDIAQVIRNLMSVSPDGWAFDYDRYYVPDKTAQKSCEVQMASQTIDANEDYKGAVKDCCAPKNSGCYDDCQTTTNSTGQPIDFIEGCCGVGFCADHSTALLSILRTLGIPADNVWSAFNGHHAWVALKCDSSIKNLGKYGNYQLHQGGQFIFDECITAGDGNWIVIDATFQGTTTLAGSGYCSELKDFWNDHGRYAFQGIVCDGTPIIPTDTNCDVSGNNVLCNRPPGCSTAPTSVVINHPHAGQDICSIVSGRVSCPLKRNPGASIGC